MLIWLFVDLVFFLPQSTQKNSSLLRAIARSNPEN